MNDDTKVAHKPATYFGLVVIAAVLTAIATHALQVLLFGDATTAVSGGAAGAVAVASAIGLKKRKNRTPDDGDIVA